MKYGRPWWEVMKELSEENARLKAEVERLTELNATLSLRYDATKSMLDGCAKEIEEMEAEVERLTKAGDNLARVCRGIYGGLPLWEEWNAAKGVQS
jgi:regulator of replication initiation timing